MVCGQVDSILAFYCNDPSLNPAVFSVKFVFEKNENKQKEAIFFTIMTAVLFLMQFRTDLQR